MSTDSPVLAAVEAGLPNGQKPRRGWFRRNWLWFVPTLLLVFMLLCCGCFTGIFFWVYGRVYDMEMCQKAMQKIRANTEVRQAIGEPMKIVRWPPAPFQIETNNGEGEAEMRWDVEGPKGVVKTHLRARLTKNHWDIVILEATLPDGKRLSFDVADGTNVAPRYQRPKTDGGKSEPKSPPPEVDLDIPDADAAPAGGK